MIFLFKKVEFLGEILSGRRYLDKINIAANRAYFEIQGNEQEIDIMWFLWACKDSPLFGKEKMATFESYFIDDKETHKEPKIHIINI